MIESVIVYGVLIFFVVFLGGIAYNRAISNSSANVSFWQWQNILIIGLFTFIFGARYGVGTDYFSYLKYYETGNGIDGIEFLFKWIRDILAHFDVHYFFYFAIWAFIQIFFFLLAFKNEQYLFPFLLLVLITGGFFITWMNVIRQSIAACIFIYSIKYLEQRSFIKYLFWIIVASLFHFSAVILILIYPVLRGNRDIFNRIYFQLGVFFAAVLYYFKGFNPEKVFGAILGLIAPSLGYKGYLLTGSIFSRETEGNTGIGYLIIISIDLIIILFSDKLKHYYNSRRFNILYTLYFIGAIARVLFADTFILLRPFLYFIFLKLIISAYLLNYLFNNSQKLKNQLAFIILIGLYMLNFIPYIYFGDSYSSEFLFFFQSFTSK